VLGWRNSDSTGSTPYPFENFAGTLCEVLVYDRQLSLAEVDALDAYLAGKYGISATAIPPALNARLAIPGSVELSWETSTGRLYQLQSTTNLAPANWLDAGVPVSGTGVLTLTNFPTGSELQNYFRLKVAN
jgi:hypothetical protein